MQIIIVSAKSDNQVIGKQNKLVWHLPADLRFFLKTIEGAYLITGRKSYESTQVDASSYKWVKGVRVYRGDGAGPIAFFRTSFKTL